jgi:pteridine reductase
MLYQSYKTALITGSSTRIGKYVAQMLTKNGWKIALHYHKGEKEAYQLAKELINLTDVMVFKADLTDEKQSSNLIHEVNKQLGPVNLLINNASIHKNDKLLKLEHDLLDKSLSIHLKAPLYLAKSVGEQNIEANIINIIDAEITHQLKCFFSYSLGKKTLLELTKMLAVNLAPQVRVNAIAPGPILFKEGQDLEIFNQLIINSPLKIKAELEDLYQSIQFLINTRSITGQCIFLDGGIHLT